MKHLTVIAASLSLTLAAQQTLAQDMKPKPAGDAAPMMAVDRDSFVKVVSSANEFEIKSSEMAKQKAADGKLKEAAEMIIQDHTKAGDKLKATLESKGVTPPSVVLSPKHRKMIEQLETVGGSDFDVLYLDMQAQAHMEAVGLFRTYAGGGDDQEIIGFAKETLPALETHLAHVKMLISNHH